MRTTAAGFAMMVLLGSCSTVRAQDYYVDYKGGNDASAGITESSAWQHSPGDPGATGRAAALRPGAGDTIHFKGGVAYRGTILVNGGGAAGRPLTFTGAGFGDGPAIIDGGDPVISQIACPSQADCGGSPDWAALTLVAFTPPPTALIKFYDAGGPLFEAQIPASSDPFFADNVSEYLESPLSEKASIEAGQLRSPVLAKRLAGRVGGTLSIWVYGNQVVRRTITGIQGDVLTFVPDGIKLYPTRPGAYALTGLAAAISAPGQYAVLAKGKAVVRTRPGGGPLSIGNGRGGFDLNSRSGVTITGFIFTHHTSSPSGGREGTAVIHTGNPSTAIEITGNRFENSAMWSGAGVITLRNVDGVVVKDNVIASVERGSGMRVGGVTNMKVTGNTITRVGRTGIAFLGVSDGVISGNVIDDLHGIHGNGISLYLTNRRVSVTDNRVLTTNRPMTFHGDKARVGPPGDHDFIIQRNIFIATDNAQAALTSWGAATRGVTIRDNVLIAPRGGILLNSGDTNVTVDNNYVSNIIYNHGQGVDWKIGKNRTAPNSLKLRDKAAIPALCRTAGFAPGTTLGGVAC